VAHLIRFTVGTQELEKHPNKWVALVKQTCATMTGVTMPIKHHQIFMRNHNDIQGPVCLNRFVITASVCVTEFNQLKSGNANQQQYFVDNHNQLIPFIEEIPSECVVCS